MCVCVSVRAWSLVGTMKVIYYKGVCGHPIFNYFIFLSELLLLPFFLLLLLLLLLLGYISFLPKQKRLCDYRDLEGLLLID